jgi:hypothetical protein
VPGDVSCVGAFGDDFGTADFVVAPNADADTDVETRVADTDTDTDTDTDVETRVAAADTDVETRVAVSDTDVETRVADTDTDTDTDTRATLDPAFVTVGHSLAVAAAATATGFSARVGVDGIRGGGITGTRLSDCLTDNSAHETRISRATVRGCNVVVVVVVVVAVAVGSDALVGNRVAGSRLIGRLVPFVDIRRRQAGLERKKKNVFALFRRSFAIASSRHLGAV